MNFGEVLLEEKANRKPNSGENLYLAALQLDQGRYIESYQNFIPFF